MSLKRKVRFLVNIYGGALVLSKYADYIINKLEDKKKSLNLLKEVKWSRVTTNYLDKYIELTDFFFDFIADNLVKVRIMFTLNYLPAKGLTPEQKENEFYILYYQFFKNTFGIEYCNEKYENVFLIKALIIKGPILPTSISHVVRETSVGQSP